MALIDTNLGVKKWQLSATFGKHSELLKWEKWEYLNLIVFASTRELFNRRFSSYKRKSHSDENLSGFFVWKISIVIKVTIITIKTNLLFFPLGSNHSNSYYSY